MESLKETPEQRRARNTENTRRYRARHPERVRASRKQVYLGRKIRAMNLIGGPLCAGCGCDEISYLEFNHINGGGAKEIRSIGNRIVDHLLSGKRAPVGLNILCRVCNAIDFLTRKNPEVGGRFVARWEKYSGKKAVLDV